MWINSSWELLSDYAIEKVNPSLLYTSTGISEFHCNF
uniref:Uncharacterized protein n=2 Tax=Lepeophtheirus salmonis TaxID=72036 RepID=A0A0K2V8H3_LEPSM